MIDDGTTDGQVTGQGTHTVIRFERHLPAPPALAWVAMTDPDFLAKWWGEVTVDLRPGGQFDVRWFNLTPEGERFTMHATITEILRWELSAESGGTRLVFTSTLDLPEELRAGALAGWHFHLTALRHALSGGSVDLVDLPGWDAIHQRYENQPS